MSFRDRLIIAFLAVATIPIAILGWGVRREMTTRLDAEAVRRVRAVEAGAAARLADRLTTERARLRSLALELSASNGFRIATSGGERRWLLDWAPTTMRAAGFSVLLVQDAEGRILSSGQFRNDFDRLAPGIARAIEASPEGAVALDTRTPTGPVRALVTAVPFTVRGERYTLLGGSAFDSARVAALSTDRDVAAVVDTGVGAHPAVVVTTATLSHVRDTANGGTGTMRVVLIPDTAPTQALKAGVARWLLVTLSGALLVAVVAAGIVGRVISAPIADLAGRTTGLDLDRLDQQFATGRTDELGALERTLDALTGRLRTSIKRVRDAERVAATGDLARQVNHDIKNGLTPIRNVIRHLTQTAEREPHRMASIYAERRATLESGVEYLDELARNYARLSPVLRRGPTDPRPVVMAVARGVVGATVNLVLPDKLPTIRADGIVLRRILDNLVSNAVDALAGKDGTITIAAETLGNGAEKRVRFTVADTGRGMTRDELERAFNDFYTTKSTGTGLGLTVVRRLAADVGGSVRAETAPGRGTTFMVEVPAADVAAVLPPMVYAQ